MDGVTHEQVKVEKWICAEKYLKGEGALWESGAWI